MKRTRKLAQNAASMEERRLEKSESEQPQPIRMIYVPGPDQTRRALSALRTGGQEKDGASFVMAGGRLNAMDVKQHFPDADQKPA